MQFNNNFDGDFITIYDIYHDGNIKLISRFSGPDAGPKSQFVYSNWENKTISSSSNKMLIEFKSDETEEHTGFSLSIQFTPFQNDMCQSCLDMEQKTLKSPNYPKSSGKNVTCNWIITAQHGFHITLEFEEFNVKYFVLIAKIFLALNTNVNCYTFIYLYVYKIPIFKQTYIELSKYLCFKF